MNTDTIILSHGLKLAVPSTIRLWPEDLDRISFALMAKDAGRPELARTALKALEGDLVPLVGRAVGLPRDVDIRLEKAQTRLAAATTWESREEAAKGRQNVIEAFDRAKDREWLDARHKELSSLEALRGGSVVVERASQVKTETVRVTNRDGLDTALDAGVLNAIEYAAGMRYRTLFEAADWEKGLTPSTLNGNGGGGMRNPSLLIEGTTRLADHIGVSRALNKARAQKDLADLEAAVKDHHGERAAYLLREVAGKALTLRSVTGGGNAQVKAQALLADALSLVADRFGMQ